MTTAMTFSRQNNAGLWAHYLEIEKISPSYPATSFPLNSARPNLCRRKYQVCGFRVYGFVWTGALVISEN